MSRKRVQEINVSAYDIIVILTGGAHEVVDFAVMYGPALVSFYCRLSGDGLAELSLARNTCDPH